MDRKLVCAVTVALALQIIGASRVMCPSDPNCICGGTLAVELNCNIDGSIVKINLLPNTYINIKCENTSSLDYSKLPKCANRMNTFKSVSFKDCPLPSSSFKDVLTSMGVSKTMALIFQNAKNLSGYFDRKHFAGLQDLTKLLLSINGISNLPDNLFMDINKLTWLNIRSNSINLTEELFKPLGRLETLEISHNHMTNISSNLFSHLSFLRKLSLWQSNVTWFSKDLFAGVDVLEELDLSSNGLNELPASIFKPLRKLKKLTLFSNKFSSLPQNLFKNNEELETVVILNNDVKLKELPKYLFGGLPNLKQIYIQRSGLENIPYDVFANSPLITNISLAYNGIKVLPEAIFNDQINLLELDLSHNNLSKLEPKLFSSLVRLENLNLCHNALVKVCGSTFSSLLSLIYLNMEHNNLKTVFNYLFSNNKQKMSISMAYNQLDFEERHVKNHSHGIVKWISPFAHTYNLRLLNLSHNQFTMAFDDWWANGHDNLDISNNHIINLWNVEKPNNKKYRTLIKKPIKEIWISNNPICCDCRNYLFMDFLLVNLKTKIADLDNIECPMWAREACYLRFTIFVSLVAIVVCLYAIMITVFIIYRKHISMIFKRKITAFTHQTGRKVSNYLIEYSEKDEDFVLNEVLPLLKGFKNMKIVSNPIKSNKINENIINNFASCVKDVNNFTTLVIFSPNYLTSIYCHVDIKKIHSEMLKAENTIYIFVDIDPDNSIYAFLKEQRDGRTTVVWGGPHFWDTFLKILAAGDMDKSVDKFIENYEPFRKPNQIFNTHAKPPSDISFSKLQEWPNLYNLNSLTQSQV